MASPRTCPPRCDTRDPPVSEEFRAAFAIFQALTTYNLATR
jgi:hypothetical protein